MSSPKTALIFLPAPAGGGGGSSGNPSSSSLAVDSNTSATSSSPAPTLIDHVSRTYARKPLGPYTLDHRLLVDTSSLIPGHGAPRRYTHFLTLSSRFPGKTFVGAGGTTAAAAAAVNDDAAAHPVGSGGGSSTINGSTARPTTTNGSSAGPTIITVSSHPDTLFPFMVQRMSPLWVPRQAHRIEGGASFEMADWKVRIGELKISGGQGQGRVRGCVCEVEFLGGGDDDDDGADGDQEEIGGLARAFVESLARGSGAVTTTDGIKVVGPVAGEENGLVRQYMDLLKFARS